ncbi:6-phosphogluconolactonase [compost metagenome]
MASGAAYAVTVLALPGGPAQTCSVSNASGTVGASPVTHVTILCTVDSHRVGGRITGLNGRGLVLQNNAGDDLSIDFGANGDFAFAAPVASGAGYAVSVKAQPQFVHQTCTVTDGTGQVVSGPVRTVNVHCVLAAPSAQPARFAYVSGQGDNSLTAFHIDATTGALAPLPEPPTVTGRTPMGVSLHPNDRFVYVANNSDATVSAYVVQPNGMLVPARTPTVATGAGPIFLGIDPRGRFAYAVNGSSDTVSAYRIDDDRRTHVGGYNGDGQDPFRLDRGPHGPFCLCRALERQRFHAPHRPHDGYALDPYHHASGRPAQCRDDASHGPLRLRGEHEQQRCVDLRSRCPHGGAHTGIDDTGRPRPDVHRGGPHRPVRLCGEHRRRRVGLRGRCRHGSAH